MSNKNKTVKEVSKAIANQKVISCDTHELEVFTLDFVISIAENLIDIGAIDSIDDFIDDCGFTKHE